MSAPVDVLAVMNSALGDLMVAQVGGFKTETSVPEVSFAIDAVAWMIKADTRIAEGAIRKAGGGWWMISNEDMSVLRDALARVKGA